MCFAEVVYVEAWQCTFGKQLLQFNNYEPTHFLDVKKVYNSRVIFIWPISKNMFDIKHFTAKGVICFLTWADSVAQDQPARPRNNLSHVSTLQYPHMA